MFFRTKIDGAEFGYKLAQYAASTILTIDQAAERRLALCEDGHGEAEPLNSRFRVLNTVLNEREFTIIWVFALKELIMLSTNDRCAPRINAGFVQFLNEKYASEDDVQILQSKVKRLIDNDAIFSHTGNLQSYDYNLKVPIAERRGISYAIALLIVEESLLRDDIDANGKDLLVSLLVLEFETVYKLSAKTYQSVKII
jgi:hypothetical protein